MKSPITIAQQRPLCRGFTLMELLVVILIIGILAALTLGVFRYAQESAARNRTMSTHAAIVAALSQYFEKFGEYPESANPGESDTFGGISVPSGGAHMLYQAISGDGNNAIRLTTPPASGVSESDGKVEESERENVINVSPLPRAVIYPPNAPAGSARPRMIVDGWSRPFQYSKAIIPDPNQPNRYEQAVNPTYDLWSFGPLNTAGSAPTVLSVEERKNADKTAAWIKNW